MIVVRIMIYSFHFSARLPRCVNNCNIDLIYPASHLKLIKAERFVLAIILVVITVVVCSNNIVVVWCWTESGEMYRCVTEPYINSLLSATASCNHGSIIY